MLRASRIAIGLALLALLPSSCTSPVLLWNDDGRTMSDLRTLRRQRGKQSVALTFGARLYADEIHYTDKHKRSGEASGHVLLSLGPITQSNWLIKYGYAGHALFDKRQRYVALGDRPMLERQFMTQIGTEPYTSIDVWWDSETPEVVLRGPTRTDFAKSHPRPPDVPITSSAVPSALPVGTPPPPRISRR